LFYVGFLLHFFAKLRTKALDPENKKPGTVAFDSPIEFLTMFGHTLGGKTYEDFKKSWERVTHLMLSFNVATMKAEGGVNVRVFSLWRTPWVDAVNPGETNYMVVFAPEFFETVKHCPLNLTVMRYARQSSKDWDFLGLIQYYSYL